MITISELAKARGLLCAALAECGACGNQTVLLAWTGGHTTPAGRSDYYDLRVLGMGDDGRPAVVGWISSLFCAATGHRFEGKRQAIHLTGAGIDKAGQIATELATIAGHNIHVQGVWTGWARPE